LRGPLATLTWLSELLGERVRSRRRLLKAHDDLLVPGRSDGEAILAQRPYLHVASRASINREGAAGYLLAIGLAARS
jgi:hypothetical protein